MTESSGHTRTPMSDLVAALAALSDPAKEGKANVQTRDGRSYQYRYLELPDLLAEVRGKFGAHGWAIMQQVTVSDGAVTVTNIWLHESGEQLAHLPFTLPSGRSPQDIGSSTSYARRYSLAALVGLAGSDDDDAQQAQEARRVEPLTKPVTRDKPKAADPNPWTTPPAKPPDRPIPLTARPDPGSPSTTRAPSDKQVKYLWTLMRKQGMTDEEVRAWVAHKLQIEPDWHTHDLSSADVSLLIRELKPADELPLPPQPEQ